MRSPDGNGQAGIKSELLALSAISLSEVLKLAPVELQVVADNS
jgi:hypothetical protein